MHQDILYQINYHSILCHLFGHSLICIEGKDSSKFLQGQLSNDIEQLSNNRAQINCRLSLKGKIQSFFSLGLLNSRFYLLIDDSWADELLEELKRYLIMEDVSFELIKKGDFILRTGAQASFVEHSKNIPVNYLGYQSQIIMTPPPSNERIYSLEELQEAVIYSGQPLLGKSIKKNDFINETILNEVGISYKKGCFFGQETPAKINSGRGGNYFPCLIKLLKGELPDKTLNENVYINKKKIGHIIDRIQKDRVLYCKLKRSHRILQQEMTFEIDNKSFKGSLIKFPQFGHLNNEELSQHLYLEGTCLYNLKKKTSSAIELLEGAIKLNKANADAYEALGVILGHQERYDEAIELMKSLAKIRPDSVMPHTNLSLFYMKQGRIEEAEEEKAQATLLGMKLASKKVKERKKRETDEEKKRDSREKMYRQVLDIDPEDFFANDGLARIYYAKDNLEKTTEYAKKALESNEKNSSTYLLLGMALQKSGHEKKALDIYKKGAVVAATQGDTRLANEIQSKIKNRLNQSSS